MLKQKLTRIQPSPAVGCQTPPPHRLRAKPGQCLNWPFSPQTAENKARQSQQIREKTHQPQRLATPADPGKQ